MLFRNAIALFALILPLQAAPDPPPEVESALKARINEFYQMMVDGKYRQAEQIVAEDSKDLYYSSRKPAIKAFNIGKIEYSADFQKAKVTILSKTDIVFPGAGVQRMDVPFPSNWKREDGKWAWFIDKEAARETPFGRVNPAPSTGSVEDKAKITQRSPASISSMTNAVTMDRSRIQLDPAHPKKETMTLKNTLPGPVTVVLKSPTPGLELSIAKPKLEAEGTTEVTITPVGNSTQKPDSVSLLVQPLNQTLTIAITWAPTQ